MRTRLTTTTTAAAVCLAGMVMISAGCSSSKSIENAGEATTAAPTTSAVASTVPATVVVTTPETVAPATTAAGPAPVCDDIAPTAAAVDVTVVNGDWNADGVADSALSWGEPTASGVDWFVRMQVSGGHNSAIFLGDVGAGFARVTGRADVDFSLGAPEGANEDELVAVVGSNAAGVNLGVFGLDQWGCVFQFDNGGGEVFVIPVHNAAAALSGMTCDGGAGSRFIVRLEADTADGTNWTTRDIRVQRTDENSLADGDPIVGALTGASPGLGRYGEAECEGMVLTP